MSIYWGYHCKTCRESSARWVEDPRVLRRIYNEAQEQLERIELGEPLRLGTAEIKPLFFISRHFGHELWLETDTAALMLERAESS